MHAMTITSPIQPGCVVHAIIFMLRDVDLHVPVMLIMDLSLPRVQSSTHLKGFSSFMPGQVISIECMLCGVRAHALDDPYLTRSKFNSLLTEMITPQTYIQEYIYTYKTASCLSCIRGSLRLAPNYCAHSGGGAGYSNTAHAHVSLALNALYHHGDSVVTNLYARSR